MIVLHTLSSGGGGVGDASGGDIQLKERLIAAVKRKVKYLMEEAVTKKYIHEESSSVTSLCSAVDACISHRLSRRSLGLFKTSSTTALIQKIAKTCPEADYVNRKLLKIEAANENSSGTAAGKRSCSSSDSIIKPKLLNKGSSISITTINAISSSAAVSTLGVKYLWIRLALYEKCLAKIIEHLVKNANNYYDRDALVADADYGSILSSLLVGPCALEYTRAGAAELYESDSHADELLQRHRISSGNSTPPTCHRPIINFKRNLNASSEDSSSGSFKASSPASVAKDYVESLHQNSKTTLLYGKNNVLVLPKDASEPMPGYLSLHQTVQSLTIKWTPNQLMNGYNIGSDGLDKSFYWALALHIQVDEIVYVHCHQNRGEDTGGTIILVGQDGVQQPPIHFPEGGHMQAFLSCLETGLLPHGQLDPPLWSNRGIGKIFPWRKSIRRRVLTSVMESTEQTPIDYVFRVISKGQHKDFLDTHHILELGLCSPRRQHLASCSTTGSSDCSSKSLSIDHWPMDSPLIKTGQTTSIELLCSTMRKQIISRAFYGWLAYCRHLSTVRTHLSGLVHGYIIPDLAVDEEGLTKEKWDSLHVNGVIENDMEVYRLAYFGGVQHDIRREVWPYLLGHYSFFSTPDERLAYDDSCQHYYETTMSEWLAVEAIVRQREKEKMAQAVAKLSAENDNYANQGRGEEKFETNDDDHEDDVFEINDYSDISDGHNAEDYFEENLKDTIKSTKEYKNEIGNEAEPMKDDENEIITIIKETSVTYDVMEKEEEAFVEIISEKTEQVIVEFENIDDEDEMEKIQLQENCLVDSEMESFPSNEPGLSTLNLSVRSSPSTSSYETVGNEFIDIMDFNVVGGVREAAIKYEENQRDESEQIISNEKDNLLRVKTLHCQNIKDVGNDDCNGDQVDDDQNEDDDDYDNGEDETATTTHASVIVTEVSADNDLHAANKEDHTEDASRKTSLMSPLQEDVPAMAMLDALREPTKSACASPASSNGGVYSCELLENFALNLHRIEKDVQRCDRNYSYFASENLDKLRNVISTYVWQNLDIGYMQGMCDLVAPLLVIFDDESLCYSCFCKLMGRMIENFPNGGAMDMHFANMRSLIQILDSEMYDLMDSHGDYTHFYFCYRWFLLDFKREFLYNDIFAMWEVIWAAKHVASSHFVLFIALALLETYREIILSHSMDFTDVIKFFNEMAERHDAHSILQLSRNLVLQLQTIIENK